MHRLLRGQSKRRRQLQPPIHPPQSPGIHATDSEAISQIAAVHNRATTTHVTVAQLTAEQLDHHIFSKGEWKRVRFLDHPRVPVTILLMRPRRTGGNTDCTTSDIHAEVSAIHETGPQLDLWSLTNFLAYSFSCYELCPICFSLSVANQSPITIEEAFFAKLTTESHDSTTA